MFSHFSISISIYVGKTVFRLIVLGQKESELLCTYCNEISRLLGCVSPENCKIGFCYREESLQHGIYTRTIELYCDVNKTIFILRRKTALFSCVTVLTVRVFKTNVCFIYLIWNKPRQVCKNIFAMCYRFSANELPTKLHIGLSCVWFIVWKLAQYFYTDTNSR